MLARCSLPGALLVGLSSLLGSACSTRDNDEQGRAQADGGMLPTRDAGHAELDASEDAANQALDAGSDAGVLRQARIVDDPWCVAPSASSSYGFASWAAQIAAA